MQVRSYEKRTILWDPLGVSVSMCLTISFIPLGVSVSMCFTISLLFKNIFDKVCIFRLGQINKHL